jgi:hypothetical protein
MRCRQKPAELKRRQKKKKKKKKKKKTAKGKARMVVPSGWPAV